MPKQPTAWVSKRVKTIWEWLKSSAVTNFVQEIWREAGSWEDAPRRFKVCLGEPLTEADQKRAGQVLGIQFIGANGTHSKAGEVNPVGGNGTHSEETIGANGIHSEDPIGANGIHSEDPIGASGIHSEDPVGASGIHNGGNGTHRPGASGIHSGASGTHREDPVGANGIHSGASGTHSEAGEVNLELPRFNGQGMAGKSIRWVCDLSN